jgi:hypothetical protein
VHGSWGHLHLPVDLNGHLCDTQVWVSPTDVDWQTETNPTRLAKEKVSTENAARTGTALILNPWYGPSLTEVAEAMHA